MEELKKSKLINSKLDEVSAEEAFQTKLIGILFTASWCSPCAIFEKDLAEVYTEANIGEKVIEIIQISFDKTEEVFKKSIANKPWLSLPYEDPVNKEISDKFQVQSVPMFYIINGSDGKLITDTGRKEISNEGVKIIDKWLKKSE